MQPDQKRDGLLRFFTAGLLVHSKQETIDQLGDRSQYIGLSDIGKGFECMRSAVADKAGLVAKPSVEMLSRVGDDQVLTILKQQLILQRGHWQEYGIEKAINATGTHLIPQLEISIVHNGVPVKAHLDFTIVRDAPHSAVRILELKSNENIPEHLYASYEAQLYGQIGMLCENWNKPCFSIPSANCDKGCVDMTFPELAKQLFGVMLPTDPTKVDIEGWVVSISMSEIKPFGPYIYDNQVLSTCLSIAEAIWNNKQRLEASEINLDDVSHAMGFHPLCEFCMVNNNCPKFTDGALKYDTDCAELLDNLAQLKQQEKLITKQKKSLEKEIKNHYLLAQVDANNWISTPSYRFKVTQIPGRKSINYERLSEFVGEHGEDVIHQCQETGKPYDRLYVSKINQ